MTRILSTIALLSLCSCFVHAAGEAGAPVVYSERPTLIAIGSDVWVVRGSSRATYYVGDSYWVWGDGTWYRSSRYDGGWAVVQVGTVPTRIVSLQHTTYVQYQGEATAVTMLAPGGPAAKAPPANKGHDEPPAVGNKHKDPEKHPGEAGKGPPVDEPKSPPPSAGPGPKGHDDDDDHHGNKGGKKNGKKK